MEVWCLGPWFTGKKQGGRQWGPRASRVWAGASLNPDSQGGASQQGAALVSSEPPAAVGPAQACATLGTRSCLGGDGLGRRQWACDPQ